MSAIDGPAKRGDAPRDGGGSMADDANSSTPTAPKPPARDGAPEGTIAPAEPVQIAEPASSAPREGELLLDGRVDVVAARIDTAPVRAAPGHTARTGPEMRSALATNDGPAEPTRSESSSAPASSDDQPGTRGSVRDATSKLKVDRKSSEHKSSEFKGAVIEVPEIPPEELRRFERIFVPTRAWSALLGASQPEGVTPHRLIAAGGPCFSGRRIGAVRLVQELVGTRAETLTDRRTKWREIVPPRGIDRSLLSLLRECKPQRDTVYVLDDTHGALTLQSLRRQARQLARLLDEVECRLIILMEWHRGQDSAARAEPVQAELDLLVLDTAAEAPDLGSVLDRTVQFYANDGGGRRLPRGAHEAVMAFRDELAAELVRPIHVRQFCESICTLPDSLFEPWHDGARVPDQIDAKRRDTARLKLLEHLQGQVAGERLGAEQVFATLDLNAKLYAILAATCKGARSDVVDELYERTVERLRREGVRLAHPWETGVFELRRAAQLVDQGDHGMRFLTAQFERVVRDQMASFRRSLRTCVRPARDLIIAANGPGEASTRELLGAAIGRLAASDLARLRSTLTRFARDPRPRLAVVPGDALAELVRSDLRGEKRAREIIRSWSRDGADPDLNWAVAAAVPRLLRAAPEADRQRADEPGRTPLVDVLWETLAVLADRSAAAIEAAESVAEWLRTNTASLGRFLRSCARNNEQVATLLAQLGVDVASTDSGGAAEHAAGRSFLKFRRAQDEAADGLLTILVQRMGGVVQGAVRRALRDIGRAWPTEFAQRVSPWLPPHDGLPKARADASDAKTEPTPDPRRLADMARFVITEYPTIAAGRTNNANEHALGLLAPTRGRAEIEASMPLLALLGGVLRRGGEHDSPKEYEARLRRVLDAMLTWAEHAPRGTGLRAKLLEATLQLAAEERWMVANILVALEEARRAKAAPAPLPTTVVSLVRDVVLGCRLMEGFPVDAPGGGRIVVVTESADDPAGLGEGPFVARRLARLWSDMVDVVVGVAGRSEPVRDLDSTLVAPERAVGFFTLHDAPRLIRAPLRRLVPNADDALGVALVARKLAADLHDAMTIFLPAEAKDAGRAPGALVAGAPATPLGRARPTHQRPMPPHVVHIDLKPDVQTHLGSLLILLTEQPDSLEPGLAALLVDDLDRKVGAADVALQRFAAARLGRRSRDEQAAQTDIRPVESIESMLDRANRAAFMPSDADDASAALAARRDAFRLVQKAAARDLGGTVKLIEAELERSTAPWPTRAFALAAAMCVLTSRWAIGIEAAAVGSPGSAAPREDDAARHRDIAEALLALRLARGLARAGHGRAAVLAMQLATAVVTAPERAARSVRSDAGALVASAIQSLAPAQRRAFQDAIRQHLASGRATEGASLSTRSGDGGGAAREAARRIRQFLEVDVLPQVAPPTPPSFDDCADRTKSRLFLVLAANDAGSIARLRSIDAQFAGPDATARTTPPTAQRDDQPEPSAVPAPGPVVLDDGCVLALHVAGEVEPRAVWRGSVRVRPWATDETDVPDSTRPSRPPLLRPILRAWRRGAVTAAHDVSLYCIGAGATPADAADWRTPRSRGLKLDGWPVLRAGVLVAVDDDPSTTAGWVPVRVTPATTAATLAQLAREGSGRHE